MPAVPKFKASARPVLSAPFEFAPEPELGVGQGPNGEGQPLGCGPGQAELVGMSGPGQRLADPVGQGHHRRGPVMLLLEKWEMRGCSEGSGASLLCVRAPGWLPGALGSVPWAS